MFTSKHLNSIHHKLLFEFLQVTWIENKGAMVLAGSYETSVKMMGDMGFLNSLLTFAKEQINDETVELLQPYFAAPDFNFESARKASGNVAGLCNWAAAMCKYHEVAKVVEPKIAALREAEAELKVSIPWLLQADVLCLRLNWFCAHHTHVQLGWHTCFVPLLSTVCCCRSADRHQRKECS